MENQTGKNGQAMLEFLIGLVGIMVLILALNQVAALVSHDFESILNARMDVAEDLLSSSYSPPPGAYDPRASYAELNQNINVNSDGNYVRFLSEYPQGAREDGFGYLHSGTDPLDKMVGAEQESSVQVESSLMQKVFGRGSINLMHEVWMPPWDDLQ